MFGYATSSAASMLTPDGSDVKPLSLVTHGDTGQSARANPPAPSLTKYPVFPLPISAPRGIDPSASATTTSGAVTPFMAYGSEMYTIAPGTRARPHTIGSAFPNAAEVRRRGLSPPALETAVESA